MAGEPREPTFLPADDPGDVGEVPGPAGGPGRVGLAVAAAAGCLAIAMGGIVAQRWLGGADAEPKGEVGHSATKPMVHRLPAPCGTVTRGNVERLVPGAAVTPVVHRRAGDPSASCQWEASSATVDRRLRMTMVAYQDGRISSGADAAHEALHDARLRMGQKRPEPTGRSGPRKSGAVAEPRGIGDGAAESYEVVDSGDYDYGQSVLALRVGNTYVEVTYGGSDEEQGRGEPLAERPTRAGAEAAARDIAAHLARCAACVD